MADINIGGRMPDGVKVHDFWVKKKRFVCASGAALEVEGKSTKLMGKLCLLTDALRVKMAIMICAINVLQKSTTQSTSETSPSCDLETQ